MNFAILALPQFPRSFDLVLSKYVGEIHVCFYYFLIKSADYSYFIATLLNYPVLILFSADDQFIKTAFQVLWKELESQNSQVRLSSLEICDFLFSRSHSFRLILIEKTADFGVLTLGFSLEYLSIYNNLCIISHTICLL